MYRSRVAGQLPRFKRLARMKEGALRAIVRSAPYNFQEFNPDHGKVGDDGAAGRRRVCPGLQCMRSRRWN